MGVPIWPLAPNMAIRNNWGFVSVPRIQLRFHGFGIGKVSGQIDKAHRSRRSGASQETRALEFTPQGQAILARHADIGVGIAGLERRVEMLGQVALVGTVGAIGRQAPPIVQRFQAKAEVEQRSTATPIRKSAIAARR